MVCFRCQRCMQANYISLFQKFFHIYRCHTKRFCLFWFHKRIGSKKGSLKAGQLLPYQTGDSTKANKPDLLPPQFSHNMLISFFKTTVAGHCIQKDQIFQQRHYKRRCMLCNGMYICCRRIDHQYATRCSCLYINIIHAYAVLCNHAQSG